MIYQEVKKVSEESGLNTFKEISSVTSIVCHKSRLPWPTTHIACETLTNLIKMMSPEGMVQQLILVHSPKQIPIEQRHVVGNVLGR